MSVRNFWIECGIDGRKTDLKGGPQSKDGGFAMEILMREKGTISDKKIYVEGEVLRNGRLRLRAYSVPRSGNDHITLETER